jgi:large subunit ribosomal protein L22
MIKGQNALEALSVLQNTTKTASLPVIKLIKSALASAKNQGIDESVLFVKDLRVDAGPTMKRFMPRARGSSAMIRKRTSHITLSLEPVAISSNDSSNNDTKRNHQKERKEVKKVEGSNTIRKRSKSKLKQDSKQTPELSNSTEVVDSAIKLSK